MNYSTTDFLVIIVLALVSWNGCVGAMTTQQTHEQLKLIQSRIEKLK